MTPPDDQPFTARLARAARAMAPAGVDTLVLTPGADLLYLSGFAHGHAGERLLALVLRRDRAAQWIIPAMNVPQVEAHVLSGQVVRGWSDADGYLTALRSAVDGAG